MANNFTGPLVYMDTFTSAIDLRVAMGFANGQQIYVKSIEWQDPVNTSHTALITTSAGGSVIFSHTATVVNQPIKDYIYDWLENIYIAANGVGSGAIKVQL